MGFKEIYNQASKWLTSETQNVKYCQEILKWHKYTLEFLNSPINMTRGIVGAEETIINFKEASTEKKANYMSLIFGEPQIMEMFYRRACIDMDEKYFLKKTNCVTYATFVLTFSQWMNPDNKTVLVAGTAIISKSPNKYIIGQLSDHFWVEINNQLFDNSGINGYSYTNLIPIQKIENILSGRFKFEPITKNL